MKPMFDYTIQEIENGWLLSAVVPDKILTVRTHYPTQLSAWQAMQEIVAEQIENAIGG